MKKFFAGLLTGTVVMGLVCSFSFKEPEVEKDKTFCYSNGTDGIIKVEELAAIKATRLSDGSVAALPESIDAAKEAIGDMILECPTE